MLCVKCKSGSMDELNGKRDDELYINRQNSTVFYTL